MAASSRINLVVIGVDREAAPFCASTWDDGKKAVNNAIQVIGIILYFIRSTRKKRYKKAFISNI
jgi:hypothetical protein